MESLCQEECLPKVEVWIFYWCDQAKQHLYLLLRTASQRDSFWQPVTGSVEPTEALEAAALREAQEETGLNFLRPVLTLPVSFEFNSWGKRFREHGFALEVESEAGYSPKVKIDPKEHQAYQWVTLDVALKMLRFCENGRILNALVNKLSGSK